MKLTKDYNSRDGSTEFSDERLSSLNDATSRGSDQKYIAEIATERGRPHSAVGTKAFHLVIAFDAQRVAHGNKVIGF